MPTTRVSMIWPKMKATSGLYVYSENIRVICRRRFPDGKHSKMAKFGISSNRILLYWQNHLLASIWLLWIGMSRNWLCLKSPCNTRLRCLKIWQIAWVTAQASQMAIVDGIRWRHTQGWLKIALWDVKVTSFKHWRSSLSWVYGISTRLLIDSLLNTKVLSSTQSCLVDI